MTAFYWAVEFIACFIEAFSSFYFCALFEKCNKSVKTNIILSLIIAIIGITLNSIKLLSVYTAVISCFAICIAQFIVKRKITIKTVFTVLLYYSFLFSIDCIFLFLISIITNVQINELLNNMSVQRLSVVLSTGTVVLILCVGLEAIIKNKYQTNRKTNVVLIVSTICITAISALMYSTQIYQIGHNSQLFMMLFFLIMLVMILVIYFTLMYIMSSEQKKKEISLIEQQNKMLYNNMIEQERTFKLWKQSIHDYKHKMLAMDSLLDENNYAEIHNIIKNEINLFRDKAFFISTGNKMVDIILNSKMSIANENNIKFTFNVMLGKELKTDDLDLSVILGNLLDNAIEAVRNEEEKLVHVQMNFIKDMIAIKVINTCTKASIPSDTTKSDMEFHGIGLKSVQRCVEKYDGNFSLELKNGCVTALVTI